MTTSFPFFDFSFLEMLWTRSGLYSCKKTKQKKMEKRFRFGCNRFRVGFHIHLFYYTISYIFRDMLNINVLFFLICNKYLTPCFIHIPVLLYKSLFLCNGPPAHVQPVLVFNYLKLWPVHVHAGAVSVAEPLQIFLWAG